MKYLVETTRTVRIRLSRVINADSPEQAQHRFNTGWREKWQAPQAESFLVRQKMLDDLFAKPMLPPGAPVIVTLLDDVPDRREFHDSSQTITLEPTDPLVKTFESINGSEDDDVTPPPNREPKKVKVGRGKKAHYEMKLPEPITLTKVIEHDGKLWKPDGESWCEGLYTEYHFVRLLPRGEYDNRFPVRTHNWLDPEETDYDYRYDTDTGLLCLYQGQEYVILDTEHINFRVNLPLDEDDEEQLALIKDEDDE